LEAGNMNAKDYWTIDELDAVECFDINIGITGK
jgi:hypothetical protein